MHINNRYATLLVSGFCVFASVASAATARAGTWMEVSCLSGTHSASASPGWSTLSSPNPGEHDGASTECGNGQRMVAWLGSLEPVHPYASQTLEYQPPTGSTLDGGSLEVAGVAAGHGPGAYAEVGLYAGSLGGTPFWSCAYESCSEGTRNSYVGPVQIPDGTGGNLYVSVICEGTQGSSCQEGADSLVWAEVEVQEAHVLLSNESVPGANGFGGSLLEGGARGTQQLDLTATDPSGPGVHSVTVEIEGVTAYSGTPNTNDGGCVPSGKTKAGVLMFTSPQPCLATEAVKLPVETAVVSDGEHPVKVTITDAAQNTSSVFVANVTTHNAPVASTSPSIVASNGVSSGVALSSTPGQWSAPSGAGTISYVYQWQQCSASGKECQAIPGATAATYTPSQADAGHTLKLAVIGYDNDGQAIQESAATGIVATSTGLSGTEGVGDPPASGSSLLAEDPPAVDLGAANGTPASANADIQVAGRGQIARRESNSGFGISGRLTTGTGQPIVGAGIEVLAQTLGSTKQTAIADATTGLGGAFTAKVPAGPSRVVTFGYRAFANQSIYAAQTKVSETVTAAVALRITPRHTSPTGVVTISGRVLGSIPHDGVTVALEVWYLGRWVAFRDPVTNDRGRFSVRYQFQRSRGTFPFRVRTLGDQAEFAYRAGYSNRVEVETR